jgi:hypothetical protein
MEKDVEYSIENAIKLLQFAENKSKSFKVQME